MRVVFRWMGFLLSLFFCLSFTVVPVPVCKAIAMQPVQLAAAADKAPLPADVSKGKVKTKPKSKVNAKDGEYEIAVDRNDVKKSSGQNGKTDTVSKVIDYINRNLKPIGRYILLVIVARFAGKYMKKYRK